MVGVIIGIKIRVIEIRIRVKIEVIKIEVGVIKMIKVIMGIIIKVII